MTRIPLLAKNDFEHFRVLDQVGSLSDSSVNHAFTHVAQEVSNLLQHTYLIQAGSGDQVGTIAIRAIEPEYRHILTVEPLTERELEVLQLIVDGYSNGRIAQNLCISAGTVKTHVRNILKKLCASGRTQAAIRALRSGLVH
ncbi:response regulator transcription factor [Leptolyngbya sp. FACHB-16]|nr:response regulator transcription factor [Leptolyngbya sp. FACHB-16]